MQSRSFSLRKQLIELAQVPDFDIERHFGEVGRDPHRVQRADIDVEAGNRLRDLGQRARLVQRIDHDAGHEAGLVGLVEIPAHIDPAVGLIVEALQGRTTGSDRW